MDICCFFLQPSWFVPYLTKRLIEGECEGKKQSAVCFKGIKNEFVEKGRMG